MYRKTFELKQHTPLIHFQHDQTGATLRATEVKPKLDRFILKYGFKNALPEKSPFWIQQKHNKAFNYKMQIRIGQPGSNRKTMIPEKDRNFPMFFANMGDDYMERVLYMDKSLQVIITTVHFELLKTITSQIPNFFSGTTFGMRSSKGYGSFSVKNARQTARPLFHFRVPASNWKKAFQFIDFFYQSVRGGVNGAVPTANRYLGGKFYMKPLLFLYAHDNGVKWEKKIIKERGGIFPYQDRVTYDAEEDQNYYDYNQPDWPVSQQAPNERIVRDLFGLSTQQTWKGYGRGFGKKRKASVEKAAVGEVNIARFPSPWRFKPEKRGNEFLVKVYEREIPEEYLNARFEITADGQSVGEVPIWAQFSMNEFVQDYLSVEKLKQCLQIANRNRDAEAAAETLIDIYAQIENSK